MRRSAPILALLLISPALMAHPGHDRVGFLSGAVHPFIGWDHLLAMVAVGLLAVRCGGRAVWGLPVTFMGGMLLGGLLAIAGLSLPFVEWGIALSLLVFGSILALARPPSALLAAFVVGAFALVNGHAHAAEMDHDQSFAAYAIGFLLATASLHTAGVVAALLMRRSHAEALIRVAGAVIATASVILAFSQVH